MQRSGSIYVVTNTATKEQYVGLTRKSVQKRWDAHKRTANCQKSKHYKLHIALQLHGEKVFEVSEVFVAFDEKALCDAEVRFIAEYLPAYNSSLGGAGLRPKEFNDSYRKMRSDAAKARWANPEWKAKTIASLKAAHDNDASRDHAKALAKMRTGVKASEETKIRISEAGKLRNAHLVAANSEKARMIHEACNRGANVAEACQANGMSKQTFYRYVDRLHLPFFGKKSRRHYSDL